LRSGEEKGKTQGMGLILLIIIVLLLIGAVPTRGYGWGYRSHGLLGTILIIILILWLLGRI
jgi:Na+/melibiose symporter-like transporter